jgi:RNA polymerase sigma factor (sigma-70 family)
MKGVEGDEALVTRFLNGDPEATDLLERWLISAASTYRRRLAEEWEDAVQDLRLELTRLLRSGAFRHESSLKTYLWCVVNHSCLDRLRRQSRRARFDGEPVEVASSAPSPLAESLSRESRRLLMRVLGASTPECRRLWGMILEGRSFVEMAEGMGVKAGTLRVRVMRCRQGAVRLRQRLERRHFSGNHPPAWTPKEER